MKYQIIIAFVMASSSLMAQSVPARQKSGEQIQLERTDSIIMADLIDPQVKNAASQGKSPDWESLKANVLLKYDATATDRAITKSRIYYYYGKDWSLFSTAIVHYTEAYEDKEDLRLMNKNAKFILRYSENPGEWKTAEGWVKHAVDKEPSNTAFKETYDALAVKTGN